MEGKAQFVGYHGPEVDAQVFYTSLSQSAQEIVELYHDHATCEQFHSEIKSDMDLERLPSGKFMTNATILLLGMMAYNVLRMIGQISLTGPKGGHEPRKPVVRRRLRTITQNLIGMAVVVSSLAGQFMMSLGRSNPWRICFRHVYSCLAGP